jgi:hypothetical protein
MNEEIKNIIDATSMGKLEKEAVIKSLLNLHSVSVRSYSEQDLIAAAKYGYEYRDTTSFPELSFEDNCKNNVKQWIFGVLNAR